MPKYICIIRDSRTSEPMHHQQSDTATEMVSILQKQNYGDDVYVTLILNGKHYPSDVSRSRQDEWKVHQLLAQHKEDEMDNLEDKVQADIQEFYKKSAVRLKVSLQDSRTGLVLNNCCTETTDTFEALTQAKSYNMIGIQDRDAQVVLEADYGSTTIYTHGAVTAIPVLSHLEELKKAEQELGYPDVSMYITHAVNQFLGTIQPVPIAADVTISPALDYRAYFAENELQKVIDEVSRDLTLVEFTKRLKAIMAAIQNK